jgi:predicted RNA binding protein YcfA (HicA-like mRNA interferase family)
MAIDYGGLRSLTARELIAALTRDGFYFVRQSGSHQCYGHSDGRRVTVAPHGSQARWTEDDLVRLGLVKK